jgi:hypothetical protein
MNKFLPASPRRPTGSHAADQSGLAAFESRKPACSSTMSKSARPNKARPWLKNPLPWLKNALPWLWSDDSISKHIRYGSALMAMLVFGLGGWAATGKFVVPSSPKVRWPSIPMSKGCSIRPGALLASGRTAPHSPG